MKRRRRGNVHDCNAHTSKDDGRKCGFVTRFLEFYYVRAVLIEQQAKTTAHPGLFVENEIDCQDEEERATRRASEDLDREFRNPLRGKTEKVGHTTPNF